MTRVPPLVGPSIIEALLNTHGAASRARRLVLVHGRYPAVAPREFTATVGGEPRRVRVSDQASVLGITDAWHEHRSRHADGDDLLVVTTGVADDQIGWDLRGHALRRRTITVENAEIVKQRFGVSDLDPRMYRETWLLQALLDAEPHDGWPRAGTVLTRDAAVHALLVARLGLGQGSGEEKRPAVETAVDADALLAWSRTPAGPTRFTELDTAERGELKKWLGETAGAAVPVLMSLVESGRGNDAMALGLLGAVMSDPAADSDTVLAVGGLFGQVRRADLMAFSSAVAGTLTRWIGEARNTPDAEQRVLSVVERADRLAAEAGLTEALGAGRFLPSSFDAQLRRTAAALRRCPEEAERTLNELRDHALAVLHGDRIDTAAMAVRIARWLTTSPSQQVASVADGVRTHLAEWGWVDRALTVLWAGDPAGDPLTGREYRALHDTARRRRDELDEQFGRRLAAWTRTASAHTPGGCLPVENVLTEVAVPLCGDGPAPLVLLLDGMSSAVAAQLGEEAEREGWTETVPTPSAGRAPGRLAAVSMLPSVTRISRASLLTGGPVMGGQSVESAGFAAYWKQHRREGLLFHKAAIGGVAGHRLSEELAGALGSDAVVGVVLNTVDDALDHGQQGERTRWRIKDVSFLRELLDTAKGYGRPVLVVADHGHVLERGTSAGPAKVSGAESSRWRTGTPGDGEIELSGPRVLEGGGTITAPWREDIRYTPRKAGYHGGASLAEVTVPLLVLLPSGEHLPKGWQVLPREQAVPPWWNQRTAEAPEPLAVTGTPPTRRKSARNRPRDAGEGLFAETEIAPSAPQQADVPVTLGSRVCAGEVYAAQKEYVRKAPEAKVVAAVIDALDAAGGTMSPAALAAAVSATGRVKRNVDGFIATVQRLLNVEGYPVLGYVDSGHTVKLDVPLLREQFLLEGPRS